MANPEQVPSTDVECRHRVHCYLPSKEVEVPPDYELKGSWRTMWDFHDFCVSEVWMAGVIELWGECGASPYNIKYTTHTPSDRAQRVHIRRCRRRAEQPEEVRPLSLSPLQLFRQLTQAQHHLTVPAAADRRRPRRDQPDAVHLRRAARVRGAHQPADHAGQLRHQGVQSAADTRVHSRADHGGFRRRGSAPRSSRARCHRRCKYLLPAAQLLVLT